MSADNIHDNTLRSWAILVETGAVKTREEAVLATFRDHPGEALRDDEVWEALEVEDNDVRPAITRLFQAGTLLEHPEKSYRTATKRFVKQMYLAEDPLFRNVAGITYEQSCRESARQKLIALRDAIVAEAQIYGYDLTPEIMSDVVLGAAKRVQMFELYPDKL